MRDGNETTKVTIAVDASVWVNYAPVFFPKPIAEPRL